MIKEKDTALTVAFINETYVTGNTSTTQRDYKKEIEENIFVSDADKKVLHDIIQAIYTEIAYTRYELQKLE